MAQVWLDGALVEEAEARVSPFDHALLTGDGVFETMRVYRGTAFALRRHLERLARSATGLRLPLPPASVLRSAVEEVVAANSLTVGRVRLTVTGGPSPLGSERGEAGPTVIAAASPLSFRPPTTDVVVVPWPRNERGAVAGLKTVSYAENVVALGWARDRGAGEALFANLAGALCEGTGSNVFVVVGGRLLTPPLSAGCLAGVTRDLVLELSEAETREADVPLGLLGEADEVFLTSSTREVQPVRAIDGRVLPSAPGPQTNAAATAFAELVARDLDP